MPIYEYQCQNCGHEFEVMQKFSEEPLLNCRECGKDTLRKKISATGFQLKGTGWYVTDFKDKKPTPANESSRDTTAPAVEKKAETPAKPTEEK